MMTQEEHKALESIERRVALENELERRRTEREIERLEEQANPTVKIQLKRMYNEAKELRVKLPKIVVR